MFSELCNWYIQFEYKFNVTSNERAFKQRIGLYPPTSRTGLPVCVPNLF